jgi:hypothetical protein
MSGSDEQGEAKGMFHNLEEGRGDKNAFVLPPGQPFVA